MERNKTIWGMILLMAILFIPMISAFSFTSLDEFRIDETTSVYGKYQIYEKDLLLFKGDLIVEHELNNNTFNCGNGLLCESYFTSNIEKEGTLVDKWNIYNADTMNPDTMRWFKLEFYGDVIDYENSCKILIDERNGSKYEDCVQVEVGSHKDWIQFEEGQIFKEGKYQWRAIGDKAGWKNIEWTFETYDIETTKWSTWGAYGSGNSYVNLTSPTTGSTQYTSLVTTNASSEVLVAAGLINMTLYDNSTGTWGARNTSSFYSLINFSLAGVSVSTESASPRAGLSFTVIANGIIVNVTKSSSCTADRAYLYVSSDADSGNLLATATFNENIATFDYPINTSATYFVLAGLNSGGLYTRTLSSAGLSYPQTSSQISVNGFVIIDSGGLQTNNFRNIQSISTSTFITSSYKSFTNTYASNSTNLWNYRACDSDGACGFATANRTFYVGNISINSVNYNSTTYETASENYSINISSSPIMSNVYLNYSSVIYPTTNSGNIWYYSRDINSSMFGNNSFNFIYTYDGNNISDSTYYQNVSPLVFALCNSTYSTRFLNLTFKDETTLGALNGTIPTATFVYYLDNYLLNKTLSYINTSENLNYSFCSNAVNRTLNVDSYVQYASSGYPQRIWNPALLNYNNTTTNQVLYLLGTANGIYVTFQVINSADQLLEGVEVTAVREISGTDVTVASGTTDAAGSVTFWLNPDFTHTFTFSKTGFTTYTTSFAPTQTQYTITMAGGTTEIVNDYTRGITLAYAPIQQELFNDTAYTFSFTVDSSFWSLDSFGYNLRLANGTIVASPTSTTSGVAASNSYNVNNQSIIYMDYYWIINGTTTTGTKFWIVTNTENTGWSVKHFFTRLQTYMGVGFFGLDNFGRYLIVFIILFITVGVMSYKYGLTSPLAVMTMIFLVVYFFDVVVNLIPTIRGIDNLLTYIAGIILAVVVLKEVTS
jgi:hypothetical protein